MANLGDRVKDSISPLTGIVTGRAEFLWGCVQVTVNPGIVTPEGKMADPVWLDEDRVIVVEAGAVKAPESASARLGGPQHFSMPRGG